MAGRMEGKVAFITGAARGQGRSHAVRLAEEGADIIAVDILEDVEGVKPYYSMSTQEDMDETVALVEKLGRRIVARKADVRDMDGLTAALEAGIDELGHVDTVIANAGIATYGRGWEIEEEIWQEMLDVNLTGVWHTAKAAIPHMLESGRPGSLIFTGSIGALKGVQHVAHYVSCKHALTGLMRTLANELAPSNIRVNTVNPTNTNTHMIQNPGTYGMFLPDDPEPTQEKAIPAFIGLNAMEVPWLEPVDVSNAVLFLASDEARYITGVALPVDAGATIK
jgi:SDR family mycofactocin-dependent oxidoreductase